MDGGVQECVDAQKVAVSACAEADRLVQAARQAAEDLRLARRQRAELANDLDTARLGDRQTLRAAKDEAARAYRREYEMARDEGAVMVATATWLGDVSRLNHDARRAVRQAQTLGARQAEVASLVERLELAANAARVTAESAAEVCVNARKKLAACQEASRAASKSTARAAPTVPPPPPPAPAEPMPSLQRATSVPPPPTRTNADGVPAIMAVLSADRPRLHQIVPRLAEELGEDAGRLQLLLLDLREALLVSANRECVYVFPQASQFWSQFSQSEGRSFAAALSTLGRRYDGAEGWEAGQLPSVREMAMAMSLGGRDPRSVRYVPTGSDLERLWHGVTVAVAEHLTTSAPDLRLDTMQRLAGDRAEALSELWRNWELLRPLLLADDSTLT
jgi:hypothetical protein